MPFGSSRCDGSKLKSNLKLCSNRMGLLQKKKTEIGHKARREIAELISANKTERARIRTEQVVREDYVVEAMEILQTYCELIVTRFGIFEAKNEVDPALERAVSTLIWATPRLSAEVAELEVIKKQFAMKYSKAYVESCLENSMKTVNSSVIQKLDLMAPSKQLVEMYMVEIAKTYDVEYESDLLMPDDTNTAGDLGGGGIGGIGGGGGGIATNTEQQLIDFEPHTDRGLPKLPDGFSTTSHLWKHAEASGGVAPYPENTPFPTSDPLAPPVPSQGPVPHDSTAYFGFDSKPPSYDATMFPDKPTQSAPPTNPSNPASLGGDQGFASALQAAAAEPASDTESDDQSIDELQRRFNELTKKS
ncbi:putative spindle pole body protein [Fasciola hepatica]|uniref:IST1 homolog n=1 Tax=Fasciola hepatica TaxID=6192 RepID=A0A4E0RWL4_FASHE|nr:putative spindle pole body protein [Fasciola hepatica]